LEEEVCRPLEKTVVIEQVLDEVWNKCNLAAIDRGFLAEARIHDPVVPIVTTAESFKQFVASYLAASPNLQLMLDDCVAAHDKVAVRWPMRGTHRGAFFGVAPTEQSVMLIGLTLLRLVDDQIAEYGTQWDSSGLMQQLGSVVPAKPSAGA
jgi:steroid delta-isomerase-like uncharacterized protein